MDMLILLLSISPLPLWVPIIVRMLFPVLIMFGPVPFLNVFYSPLSFLTCVILAFLIIILLLLITILPFYLLLLSQHVLGSFNDVLVVYFPLTRLPPHNGRTSLLML